MEKDNIYIKKKNISVRDLGNELMLYDGDTDKVHVLNETGAMIWNLINGKMPVSKIENELQNKFQDTSKETISSDLKEILKKLIDEGLVKIPEN